MRTHELPRSSDVLFRSAQMPDRQAQDESAVHARMGEKHFSGLVQRIEQSLIERVELVGGGSQRTRTCAEADDAERDGRKPFVIRLGVDPSREKLSQANVF